MTKPSAYGSIARLCEMYLAQYSVYAATARPPRMDRASKIAAEELDEILQGLDKALAPITFQQSLDKEAAKESTSNG